MAETIFADGFYFKERKETDKDFVLGKMSIKVDEAIALLKTQKKKDGWVNLDILKSRDGKPYVKVDTWEKKEEVKKEPEPVASKKDDDDGLPF